MRTLKIVAVVALIIVAFGAAWSWLHPYTEQDRCLDDGGCWDFERSRCEMKDNSKCRHG